MQYLPKRTPYKFAQLRILIALSNSFWQGSAIHLDTLKTITTGIFLKTEKC